MLDEAAWLVVAGVAMGFVNNLAGAGGVIGLAAFEWASGLPTQAANASLRPAGLTICLSGAAGFLSKQQPVPARAFGYGLAAFPGAVAGAVLAVELPVWVYRATLLTVVTVLLVQAARRRPRHAHAAAPRLRPMAAHAAFALVGLHMGFVQVGAGLVAMAVLSRVHSRDFVEVNAAKMVLLGVSALTAMVTFALAGGIVWVPALWLAAGAAVGSFVAGRWSVRRGHDAVRVVVLVVCAVVTVRLVFQTLAS